MLLQDTFTLTKKQYKDVIPDWNSYREAQQYIKANTKIRDGIAETWKTLYLDQYQEMQSPEGIIIATYKTQDRTDFDKESFKRDHPDLYEKYTSSKVIRTFLVK